MLLLLIVRLIAHGRRLRTRIAGPHVSRLRVRGEAVRAGGHAVLGVGLAFALPEAAVGARAGAGGGLAGGVVVGGGGAEGLLLLVVSVEEEGERRCEEEEDATWSEGRLG